MPVRSLGYLVIETKDVDLWRRYGTEVLGLAVADGTTDETLKLRMDDRPFRFAISQGTADRFAAAGWEFASEADYKAAIAALREAGTEVTHAEAAEAAARSASALARCQDPAGNGLELFWGRLYDYRHFVSPAGVSGFVTGEMGMGHAVIPAPVEHFDECQRFYTELLGFGLTDEQRFHMPGAPHEGLRVHFFHADNPRHHSMALCEMPTPAGLFHFMLEVHNVDEVGRAIDRVEQFGGQLATSLGRHTNDAMLSVYIRTPGGFEVEYGCEGLQMDWATFTPTKSLAPDFWGHKYNRA